VTAAKNDATPFVPETLSMASLRQAVQNCRGCELHRFATQAVLGEIEGGSKEKSPHAEMMMIGEQPGDKEDLAGRPFVGPAGKLLDQCLVEAGIDRKAVYVTNSVKHFKWEPRGKIRLHKKPSMSEIHACRPWLDAELNVIRPRLIVCLGAVAAQGLLGAHFRVTVHHGQEQRVEGLPPIIATTHPASILRTRTKEERLKQTAQFVADLRSAADFLRRI
jgi:uracil-DNA glycosylase family protein